MNESTKSSATCGQIWFVEGGGDYTSKGRPAVVLQHEHFSALDSVTVCLFTSNPSSQDAPIFRQQVQPTQLNGLARPSWLMIDKIITVRRSRLKKQVGRLEYDELSLLLDRTPTFQRCGDSRRQSWRRILSFIRGFP